MKSVRSLGVAFFRREQLGPAAKSCGARMYCISLLAGGRNLDPAPVPGSRDFIAGTTKKRARQVWTPEEDDVLRSLVGSVEGRIDWNRIASSLAGRKPSQCKWRWDYSLNTTIKLGDFTTEEDRKLAKLVKEHGKKWTRIASLMDGRTRIQCRQRWGNLQAMAIPTKGPWSMDEIATFLRMQSDYGNKFVMIANHLNRPLHEVHTQYRRFKMESPTRHSRFSSEEVATLKEAVEELGHRSWQAVANRLPGRTPLQCKSKWQYLQRLEQPAGGWTAEEDAILAERVERFQDNQWTLVAEALNRSGAECRARWKNCLHRRLNENLPWTSEEDDILLRLYNSGKRGDAMMSRLPRRSLQSIRNRLAVLCPKEDQRDWTDEETFVLLRTLTKLQQRPIDWELVAERCGFPVSARQCATRYRLWRNSMRSKNTTLVDSLSNLQPMTLQSLLDGHTGETRGDTNGLALPHEEGESKDREKSGSKDESNGGSDGDARRRKGRLSRRSPRKSQNEIGSDQEAIKSIVASLFS